MSVSIKHLIDHNGFILPIVMLLTVLLASLCLLSMRLVISQSRLTAAQSDNLALFLAADTDLISVESLLMRKASFPINPPFKDIPTDSSFWLAYGKQLPVIATILGYAVVEQLETDPCLVIFKAKHPGVNFYRISVMAAYKGREDKLILQATYAGEAEKPFVCNGILQTIQAGQQSWHRLS